MLQRFTLMVIVLSLATELTAQTKGKIAKESIEFAARKLGARPARKLSMHALKKTAARGLTKATADDAAIVISKHRRIAQPLVKQFGPSATQAYARLNSRNARRLAILSQDGPPPNKELLGVIARYGNPAMEFIWKNKAALLTASALATFVANPEPFIDGLAHLSTDVAEHVLEPLASGAATRTNWTLLIPVVLSLLVAGSLIRRR
jgi:hypothetical protein